MADIIIEGGRVLLGSDLADTSLRLAGVQIAEIGHGGRDAQVRIDATGTLVLPGIVDLHGDAFERQLMPRPGVGFPIEIALLETDRQLVSNGITTAFHGITCSWEPGLRSAENASALLDAIHTLRPQFAVDTRVHLRHETFNLDAESRILDWLAAGQIDLIAFNDHMSMTALDLTRPEKRTRMAERAGLSSEAFGQLVERVATRSDEVAGSIARLAAASQLAGIPALSHDDATPAMRRSFRALGARIAEFPINEATAREAVEAGEFTVFGAPNVVRGGSHTGWSSASDMISKGLCSILASDYYYPAMLLAAFRLVSDRILPLPAAWDLISRSPAAAAGLNDRGQLSPGLRADVVLVDPTESLRPRIAAVIAAGKIVYVQDADRISRVPPAVQRIAAA